MNCSRFEALLTDYLDGGLDPRVQAAATQHLDVCAECSGLLKDVQACAAELGVFPEITPSPALVEGIVERTCGRPRLRKLWTDLLAPSLRPLLSQRYAFSTLIIFVFLSLMVNLVGPDFAAFSFSSLRPSALLEEADRVSSQLYKKWTQAKDYRSRFIAEIGRLKEDLYGRLDYHLITILFKSYQESLKEQEKQEAKRK